MSIKSFLILAAICWVEATIFVTVNNITLNLHWGGLAFFLGESLVWLAAFLVPTFIVASIVAGISKQPIWPIAIFTNLLWLGVLVLGQRSSSILALQ